jgi:hypothetical protein
VKHSPTLGDTEILDQVVTIRLASDLRRRLSSAARTKGVSISEEIRRRLAVSFTRRVAPAFEEARE